MQEPRIQSFFDPETFTVTHVVSDPVTRRAAIIDSVLDYDPMGRTTVMEQREKNIHVHDGVTEAEFVNMRAGRLPPPEDNGVSYLKIPVNAL